MKAKPILCEAWGSDAVPDTYLMVDSQTGLEAIPEELAARFKNPRLVTKFELSPARKMAAANPEDVLSAIFERGYYLQLPPPRDQQMSSVAARNEKLSR
jgi:uncharacterized protein YcgL (UPF0745 family)